MTLLVNRLGTTDHLDTNGVILFLEDLDEYLYAFESDIFTSFDYNVG